MESGGTSGTTSEVVPAPAAAPAQNSHTPEPTCVCVHNPSACSTRSCTMLDRGVPMSFGHATALVSHWRRWKGCSRCCASVEPPFRQVEGRAHALLRRALRHVAPRQRRVKDGSGRRHKVGSAPFHVLAAAVCAKFEEQDVRTPADAENNYRAVDKALRAARSLEHARDIAASCAGGLVDFAAQVRAVLVREACTLLTVYRVRPDTAPPRCAHREGGRPRMQSAGEHGGGCATCIRATRRRWCALFCFCCCCFGLATRDWCRRAAPCARLQVHPQSVPHGSRARAVGAPVTSSILACQ